MRALYLKLDNNLNHHKIKNNHKINHQRGNKFRQRCILTNKSDGSQLAAYKNIPTKLAQKVGVAQGLKNMQVAIATEQIKLQLPGFGRPVLIS